MATIVWFRDDLRVADHPALADAANAPDGVVCVYVWDESSAEVRPLGGAAKWWLHHSLGALQRSLAGLGVPLVLRRGAAEQVIPALVREVGATRVLWNRRYGPEREIDARLKLALREQGVAANSYIGGLLHEPWTVLTGEGTPFRVYSPFWRATLRLPEPAAPIAAPSSLTPAIRRPESDLLDSWRLTPSAPDWATGLARRWTPGEAAAAEALTVFLDERAPEYEAGRDIPSIDATSTLSPHLRWGELSPRTVWHRALASGQDVGMFLSELGWREFAHHTRFHWGDIESTNLNPRFDQFPWRTPDADDLSSWQHGRTGIPIVDAGMHELWETGFMHNRVRMVAASFLTKHLLTDWRVGEAWFWDTLVDADAASNPFNWQWVSGSGLDAAPFFRIFNPVLQQQKFDPDGRYVERWAPDSLLTPPIVDLAEGRRRALLAYEQVRSGASHVAPR